MLSDEEKKKLLELDAAALVDMVDALREQVAAVDEKREKERRELIKKILAPASSEEEGGAEGNTINNNDLSKDKSFQTLKNKFKGR